MTNPLPSGPVQQQQQLPLCDLNNVPRVFHSAGDLQAAIGPMQLCYAPRETPSRGSLPLRPYRHIANEYLDDGLGAMFLYLARAHTMAEWYPIGTLELGQATS